MKLKVSYRIIHFTKPNKWVAMAWQYDAAILYATPPADSYADARIALEQLANASKTLLSYFDGEYTCAGEGEQLVALPSTNG